VSDAADPFRFVWSVDQAGYEIARVMPQGPPGLGPPRECEVVRAKGGPPRSYWPLDDEALWLTFAETCRDAASVIAFANEFGPLRVVREGLTDRVSDIIETAATLRRIEQQLHAGERLAATQLFADIGLPTMKEGIFWYADSPEVFEFWLVPLTLRDALLHEAGLAITGNRHFRRCRNEGCANWFRLGGAQPRGTPKRTTGVARAFTARREFCSDRCRVASARRQKRKA
jgi:hypothetical protein